MRMNIGIMEYDFDSVAVLFGDDREGWDKWYELTFSPDVEGHVLSLAVHGATYRERQESLRDVAVDFSHESLNGLSWGEWAEINGWFEEQGRKYGLLREFRENGIC